MGTTAQKIQYLDGTKTLLKDTINLTGAGITNDTFRSYANKLKLGLINALNDNGDTIYSNLEKVSGIGSNLSLTPTYKAPIKLNEIQGDTLQNGTPTPSSPVPIQSVTGLQNVEICGKNLINGLLDNSTTGKKLERTINANENFYLYIKTNNTTSDRCYAFLDSTNVGTIWVSNNNGTLTFSGSRNFAFNRIRIQDNTTVSENMLTLGSTATEYEPYKGNTYEVNLGKNLLNAKNGSYSYGTTNTWVVQNHEVKMSVNDITYQGGNLKLTDGTTSRWADGVDNDIAPSGTYTLSVDKTGTITFGSEGFIAFYVKIYNADGTTATGSTLVARDNQNKYTQTFTVDSGKHIGEVTIYSQYIQCQDVEFKIQLEKGPTDTSYSPYFTPIELNKIGDYEDSIKKSTGKNLIQEVVQGSFNFNNGTNSDNATRVRTNVFKVKPNTTYTVSSKIALGECCTYYYENDGTTGISGIIVVNDTTTKTASFTTPNNAYYMKIRFGKEAVPYIATDDNNIMLNEGSTALPYEPYGKVWYVTKNAIKYNVDTTQLTLISSYSNIEYAQIPKQNNYVGYNSYDQVDILCDRALNIKQAPSGWNDSSLVNKISGNPDKLKWWVGFTKGTGLDAIKTALTGSYIVYPLATPIYEIITNTELIEQLETLYNAKSEDGTTNIVITSNDLPMLMDVSVIKGDA